VRRPRYQRKTTAHGIRGSGQRERRALDGLRVAFSVLVKISNLIFTVGRGATTQSRHNEQSQVTTQGQSRMVASRDCLCRARATSHAQVCVRTPTFLRPDSAHARHVLDTCRLRGAPSDPMLLARWACVPLSAHPRRASRLLRVAPAIEALARFRAHDTPNANKWPAAYLPRAREMSHTHAA
jgi:hypothetical protein